LGAEPSSPTTMPHSRSAIPALIPARAAEKTLVASGGALAAGLGVQFPTEPALARAVSQEISPAARNGPLRGVQRS
jgi:hypothetical protein